MGERLRRRVLGWLRVDLVFRAGLAYLRYRQIAWFLTQAGTVAGFIGLFLLLRTLGAADLPAKLKGLSAVLRPGLWVGLEAFGFAVFLLQLPFTWLALRWDYDCRWYLLSDRCLRVQEGILALKEQTFTLANIQDVQVKQNPLQRLFGLWDVEVRTAGGGEDVAGEEGAGHQPSLHTAVLKGVEQGARIRDRLLARMSAFKDAGLGEVPRETPDLARSLARVRLEAEALRRSLGA